MESEGRTGGKEIKRINSSHGLGETMAWPWRRDLAIDPKNPIYLHDNRTWLDPSPLGKDLLIQ